ncbi:Glyoxalase/Bleomycin resistance protein/Dioxygenase superfamily [Rhizobium leguminosarum bv. viciae WSM1455]|nr:Glyoxalase/Bleomycin resistance protein/Dioxygenase superfamily [Rhizobium leguminosarum bv. viciae WSM1455]
MRLNQVTVMMPDLDAGWNFYCALGLKPVVDARPRYARFLCPDGDSTFSLHQGEGGGGGTTVYFECEKLDETVGSLSEAGLRFVTGPEDRAGSGARRSFSTPAATASSFISPDLTAPIRRGAWIRWTARSRQPRRLPIPAIPRIDESRLPRHLCVGVA